MIWVFYGALVLCTILSFKPENVGWKIIFWLMAGVTIYLWIKEDDLEDTIILFAIFVLIVSFVKITNWFVKCMTDRYDRKKDKAKQAAEEAQKEKERQDALARQKALEDKYFNSPLTRKIIDGISESTDQLPEEITIYDDHVTGRTNGRTRTFDFSANRVPFLEEAYACTYIKDEVDFLLKPQIALGNAINRILNGQYEIHDEANYKVITRTDSDGEFHHLYEYISNHVLLRLKATNQW